MRYIDRVQLLRTYSKLGQIENTPKAYNNKYFNFTKMLGKSLLFEQPLTLLTCDLPRLYNSLLIVIQIELTKETRDWINHMRGSYYFRVKGITP